MIVAPSALGRALRRTPVAPTSVAALLGSHDAYLCFCRIVREIVPDAETEILAARQPGAPRENARVWSFLRHVEAAYFPIYEADEYEQLACGIPFVRHGWSFDRLHELEMRPGELLIFTLCAQPVEPGYDSRVPLLDAAERYVPRAVLMTIPDGGLEPADLHARLDGTPYAAAAEFADWLWADTGTVFLDLDDEVEVSDAEWSRETVLELADQWRRAAALLDRVGALATWLEADPPACFTELLEAVLGHDTHLAYERERRLYACEITEAGLVPVLREEPGGIDTIALPMGAPAGSGARGGPAPTPARLPRRERDSA